MESIFLLDHYNNHFRIAQYFCMLNRSMLFLKDIDLGYKCIYFHPIDIQIHICLVLQLRICLFQNKKEEHN